VTKLILQPSIKEATREELEEHLDQIRARRLVAAVEYYNNRNEKLANKNSVLGRKIAQNMDRLEKEMETLDRALVKVEERLEAIDILRQEMGSNVEEMVDPNEEIE
jgi:DNA repair ATPase RecN